MHVFGMPNTKWEKQVLLNQGQNCAGKDVKVGLEE